MTPEQYQRLIPLFHAAMELPTERRAGKARELCADDGELLRGLLDLLHAAEQPPGSLGQAPMGTEGKLGQGGAASGFKFVSGRFRLVRPLGRGGMGKVFEAVDRETGKVVAIKLIQTRGAFDENLRMRFLTEARSVGGLRHPNIVELYDIGQAQGHLYLVMEYLEGRSLDKLIPSDEAVDFRFMLRIVSQAAKALGYAHSKGVVHGDIKPANIMVLRNGTAKLLDFGVAQQQQNGMTNFELDGGGTPLYMSPERFDAPAATPASDVWAIGVMLFECLTRKRPFRSEEEIKSAPAPAIEGDSPFAQELNRLIAQTLMKNPAARPRNAGEVAAELDRLCDESMAWLGSGLSENSQSEARTQDGYGSYELPKLGFSNEPNGTVTAKASLLRWERRRRLSLAWRERRVKWILAASRHIVPTSLPMIITFAVVSALTWATLTLFYLPAVFCWLLGATERVCMCKHCRVAMRRTTRWIRFASEKAEVMWGRNDCMAALKHGLWEEAAKVLELHGKESFSPYTKLFAPTRFCLDFFECDTCRDHGARLIAEDREDNEWSPREAYFEAYWQESQRRPRLLFGYLGHVLKHILRVLAEMKRIRVSAKAILIPATVCALIAGSLSFHSTAQEQSVRRLLKKDRVCYGYSEDARALARQPRPYSHVALQNESQVQAFLRGFKCDSYRLVYSNCEMYCTAK